jgi:hypothetical protein
MSFRAKGTIQTVLEKQGQSNSIVDGQRHALETRRVPSILSSVLHVTDCRIKIKELSIPLMASWKGNSYRNLEKYKDKTQSRNT